MVFFLFINVCSPLPIISFAPPSDGMHLLVTGVLNARQDLLGSDAEGGISDV